MVNEVKLPASRAAKMILVAIEKHEAISREEISANVLNATKHLKLSEHKLCELLAKICGLNTKTVYLWIAHGWTAKFTLKALAQISVALNIPLTQLLEKNNVCYKDVRPENRMLRPSYEQKVIQYAKENPNKSAAQIAQALGISENTVYRHLKKLRNNN